MSGHRYPLCQVSGKIRYGERKDIKLEMRRAESDRSRARLNDVPCARREVRSYRCCDCSGWHLTSQPMRPVLLISTTQYAVPAPGPAAQAIRRIVAATGLRVGAAA
jgi:hypothetical protein